MVLSSDEDDDGDDGDDFIPTKRKKVGMVSKSKFSFEEEDSDGENSEVERTKELIKKLTPVKETKAT